MAWKPDTDLASHQFTEGSPSHPAGMQSTSSLAAEELDTNIPTSLGEVDNSNEGLGSATNLTKRAVAGSTSAGSGSTPAAGSGSSTSVAGSTTSSGAGSGSTPAAGSGSSTSGAVADPTTSAGTGKPTAKATGLGTKQEPECCKKSTDKLAASIKGMRSYVEEYVKQYVDQFSDWLHGSQRRGAEALATKVDDLSLVLSGTCSTTDTTDNTEDDIVLPARIANFLDSLQTNDPNMYDMIVSGGKRVMDAELKDKRNMTQEVMAEISRAEQEKRALTQKVMAQSD
jgi:hypothetical protein